MSLSLSYITNRKLCEIRWLVESLARQIQPNEIDALIIVDFWCQPMLKDGWSDMDVMVRKLGIRGVFEEAELGEKLVHVPPMPNVWSGPHRLPKDNWFSAAASRNTSILYCPSEFLAYVDDLSVLSPSWMRCVRDAMWSKYIALGSYRKVRELVVEKGVIKSFESPTAKKTVNGVEVEFHPGDDTRLGQVTQDVTPCHGGWLYGCSLAGPLELFLKVNGWPAYCDGLSSEDCCMGACLQNSGADLRYDRRMMTLESEEGHGRECGFKKADKGPLGTESDKSHCAIRIAERSTRFDSNPFDIRKLREDTLARKPLPLPTGVTNDWFDSEPIANFK